MRPHEDKIPYELWFSRKETIRYFKNFRSKCYIINTNDYLGKFDDRVDEGIFIGYSSKRKAYQYFNKRLSKIVDSVDIKVNEGIKIASAYTKKYHFYDDLIERDNEELESKLEEK